MHFCVEGVGAGRINEILDRLAWAEEFESNTELGPAYAERISELQRLATGALAQPPESVR
jgi:hypothetical protein